MANKKDDDLRKRIQEAKKPTLGEEELSRRIEQSIELREALTAGLESGLGSGDPKLLNQTLSAINKSAKAIARDEPRLELKQAARLERQGSLIASTVQSMFSAESSSTRGRISQMARSSDIINGSLSLTDAPYEELEERQRQQEIRLGKLGQRAGSAASALILDPNNPKSTKIEQKLQRTLQEREEVLSSMAVNEVTLKRKKSLGLDPESKIEDLYKTSFFAQSLLNENKIAQNYGSDQIKIKGEKPGEEISVKKTEIDSKLVEESKNLLESMKKLAKETDHTSESFKKQRAIAEQHKENIETLRGAQKAKRDYDEQTYTDAVSKAQKYAAYGSFANIAGGAAQELFVNQRKQTMANQRGFAQFENMKYDTYRAALSGDVQSMMMLGQFSGAEDFGGQLKAGQTAALGLKGVGAGFDIKAGSALIGAGAAGSVGGTFTGAVGQSVNVAREGAQMVAGGTANLITIGEDIRKSQFGPGGSANTEKLQGAFANVETMKAITKIPAFQQQQLLDFSRGMGEVARGMGGQGEAFLNESLGSNKMLDRMQSLRMSPEEMTKMMSFGVNEVGSTFTAQSAFAARGLEKSGIGTKEQNLQRMAMLSQAGANNPETALSNVLEAAVGRGFDNSKSMSVLVQNTAEMAKQSATSMAAGLDVTGSISTILAAGADKNMPNREFALERSRTVQEAIQGTTANTGTDLLGLMNTSTISSLTGLSGKSATFAAKISMSELRSLKGKSKGEIEDYFAERGVDPNEFGSGAVEGINQLMKSKAEALLRGKTGMGLVADLSEKDKDKILSAFTTGDPSKLGGDKRLQAIVSQLQEGIGSKELIRGVGAGFIGENEPNSKAKVEGLKKGEGGGELQKAFDAMSTSGAAQLTDAAKRATDSLGSAAKALKGFAQIAVNLRASDYEKIATDAAAKAAGTGEFSKAANEMFSNSVGKFGDFVQELTDLLKTADISGRNSVAPAGAIRQLKSATEKQRFMKTSPGGKK